MGLVMMAADEVKTDAMMMVVLVVVVMVTMSALEGVYSPLLK